MANNMFGLLRSLCVQIVKSTRGTDLNSSDVLNQLKELKDPLKSWNLINLKETFIQLLKHLPRNLCMFVDGLDEFQGPVHELLQFLKNLPHKASGEKKIKICLASRPDSVIAMALESQPGVAMHGHNYEGIERYVSHSIKKLSLSPGDES